MITNFPHPTKVFLFLFLTLLLACNENEVPQGTKTFTATAVAAGTTYDLTGEATFTIQPLGGTTLRYLVMDLNSSGSAANPDITLTFLNQNSATFNNVIPNVSYFPVNGLPTANQVLVTLTFGGNLYAANGTGEVRIFNSNSNLLRGDFQNITLESSGQPNFVINGSFDAALP